MGVIIALCLLPFFTYFIFPHEEHLEHVSGTISGQRVQEVSCTSEGTDSVCWKGVVNLGYELHGQNHSCSLRVMKNTTFPSTIEYSMPSSTSMFWAVR